MDNFHVYRGAIHIHTILSDGSGDINTVIKAAKQNGLDWIIITDHNHYDTEEGIINGVYVIKAQEISKEKSNHYLAFGLNETIVPTENPEDYVNKVRKLGGFGFAAHPDEGFITDRKEKLYRRKNSYKCIQWTNKNLIPDGVEIWNWFSNWADNMDDRNLLTLAYAYLFKHDIVTHPSSLTLNWWDKLNNETEDIIPAIGGVDAHALKISKYIVPVTVFPYKTCFSTIINVISLKEELSKDFKTAKDQILNAIKYGQNIIINSHVTKQLPLIYVSASEKTYDCGEKIIWKDSTSVHFETTDKMKIYLMYNGEEVTKYNTCHFIHPIRKSGKYRLEVFYNGKGFLYTNPFNIKERTDY